MSTHIYNRFLEISSGLSKPLRDAIAQAGPLSLRKRNDQPLPEVLCRVVAGQQLSTAAASSIWERVQDSAGGRQLIDHIAETPPELLRACGLSRAKARSMKEIVDAAKGGELDERELATVSHEERSEQLTTIWGVGKWTADMVGIFYFGSKDVWPDNDVTVRKTLERLTSKRRKTALTARQFAPHRSYLALYMYRIADPRCTVD